MLLSMNWIGTTEQSRPAPRDALTGFRSLSGVSRPNIYEVKVSFSIAAQQRARHSRSFQDVFTDSSPREEQGCTWRCHKSCDSGSFRVSEVAKRFWLGIGWWTFKRNPLQTIVFGSAKGMSNLHTLDKELPSNCMNIAPLRSCWTSYCLALPHRYRKGPPHSRSVHDRILRRVCLPRLH